MMDTTSDRFSLQNMEKKTSETFREYAHDVYGLVDAYKMSLVPDLVLPPKFKVPTFDKYDGTKCPSTHLYMYCKKMTGYTSNDKLLVHCFQDNLSGSATRWYNLLNRDQIKSWTDLAKAFLVQYKNKRR